MDNYNHYLKKLFVVCLSINLTSGHPQPSNLILCDLYRNETDEMELSKLVVTMVIIGTFCCLISKSCE